MTPFVAFIHKETKSDFGVSFPDFPGCITAGKTMQEAYFMAQEALSGHIETLHSLGEALPARPLTLDQAMRHPSAKGALCSLMVHAVLPGRSKRINITMNEDLIERIDRVSDNRSAFLAAAAMEKLVGGQTTIN